MALKRYPGFIDVHVHLREPGATHKEDFLTGSRAAVAGGFTFVLDMPNNKPPTFTLGALEEKIRLADKKAICTVGFHFGTNGKNLDQFSAAYSHPRVFGLKVYLNQTTGDLLIEDPEVIEQIFMAWQSEKPILVHAEMEKAKLAIALAEKHKRRLHICHISKAEEVAMVRQAKKQGLPVTAGATPHHLFLIDKDVEALGPFAMMKPPLGTKADQEALWQGLTDGTIDIVESDHAPHTKEEKLSDKPPFGVPNLETTLGLMFKAAHEGKLTKADVVRLLYDAPRRIFNLPEQVDTFVELDPEESYVIGTNGYQTKCGWSPFDGWTAYGRVQTVVLNNKPLVANGNFINHD